MVIDNRISVERAPDEKLFGTGVLGEKPFNATAVDSNLAGSNNGEAFRAASQRVESVSNALKVVGLLPDFDIRLNESNVVPARVVTGLVNEFLQWVEKSAVRPAPGPGGEQLALVDDAVLPGKKSETSEFNLS